MANLPTYTGNLWSPKQVRKLISLIRDRPYMYDPQNRFYKNKGKRTLGLEEIAKALCSERPNTTVMDCRRKWHCLRITYMSERRKVLSSRNKEADEKSVYVPSLYYYKEMEFIDQFTVQKGSTLTLNGEEEKNASKFIHLVEVQWKKPNKTRESELPDKERHLVVEDGRVTPDRRRDAEEDRRDAEEDRRDTEEDRRDAEEDRRDAEEDRRDAEEDRRDAEERGGDAREERNELREGRRTLQLKRKLALDERRDKLKEKRFALEERRLALEEKKLVLEEKKLVLEGNRLALEGNRIALEEKRLALEGNKIALEEEILVMEEKGLVMLVE